MNKIELNKEIAEEVWQANSELIGDRIDELENWSGIDAMKEEDFYKAVAEYSDRLNKPHPAQLAINNFTKLDMGSKVIVYKAICHYFNLLPNERIKD